MPNIRPSGANGQAVPPSNSHADFRPPRPTVQYRDGWADRIPLELRERPQWVCWRYAWRAKEGKWTKAPIRAAWTRGKGSSASSTNSETWSTFKVARAAFLDQGNDLDGVGFVLAPDDPYVGGDLDHCIDDAGNLDDRARGIIALLDSYTERSPSGRGLRFVVRAPKPSKGFKAGPIEMYGQGRYLTITGDHWPGSPATIEDRPAELAAVHAEVFPPPEAKASRASDPERRRVAISETEQEILARAFRSRNGRQIEALCRGDTSGYPSQSEAELGLCLRLLFWFRGDVAAVERAYRQSDLYRDKWERKAGAKTYGERTLAKALEKWDGEYYEPPRPRKKAGDSTNGDVHHEANGKPPEGPDGAGVAEDDRPEIEITTERHIAVAEAIRALARDPELFYRAERLVKVVSEADPNAELQGGVELRNAQGSPRIVPLSESVVGCYLTKNAKYYEWRTSAKGEARAVDCHPPVWLIRAVADFKHWPEIRPLRAVVECPYIRSDGSVIQAPGYDRRTGTLYRPSGEFPSIPGRASRDEAEAAAKMILKPMSQFPFASDNDRAVYLAGLLNMLARQAIRGPVPGIAVIGNRAGCGKGLLIDTIGIQAYGNSVPTTLYPEEKAEAAKVRVAIALSGKPLVHFDNLEEGRPYGNGPLDSTLTSLEVDDRILGTSESTGNLAIRACFFLSGNNIVPAKDAYRRWLPLNLATGLERPEERDDIAIKDLRAYIQEHRGELVRAALTILVAHANAGYPNGGWAPLGSFEDWDRIVRGAAWHATGWDCCATRRTAADESPDRLDRLALLEGWLDLPVGGPDGRGHTTEDAVRLVAESPERFDALHSALTRRSRDGKLPTARQVGNFIRGMKGARFGGMMFQKAGEDKRSALWRVIATDTIPPDQHNEGESGESGESSSNPLRAGKVVPLMGYPISDTNILYGVGSEGHSPDSPDSPDEPAPWEYQGDSR